MRYLNFASLVVVAGAMSVFACDDADELPGSQLDNAGGDAGNAGNPAQGGATAVAGRPGAGSSAGGAGSSAGGAGSSAGGAGSSAGGAGSSAGGAGSSAGGAGSSAGGAGSSSGGTAGTAGSIVTGGTGGLNAAAGEGGAAGEAGSAAGAGGEPAVEAGQTLKVTVGGLPTGSTASVTVNGPADYVQNISSSTTFSNLDLGNYTIGAPPIRVTGTLVDSVFEATVTGSPAAVVQNATTTADVSYARRPGTGMLWATNGFSRGAFGFDSAALVKTGNQAGDPTVALTLNVAANALGTPAIAFSSKGEMWIGSCRNAVVPQVLTKYAPAKIGTTGTPAADVTLTLPATDGSYDCANALAFDAVGNLWVGMNHSHILRFNAADLTASGTPAPSVVLTSATYLNGTLDLAFDNSGNLFVASYLSGIVSRLDASQLLTSDPAVVPAVRLTVAPGAGPGGLVVGGDGALWISDYNNSTIVKLNPADLGTTGTPVPALTLTNTQGPEQLAFDNAGNLWVAAYDSGTINAYSAADITTGGSKTPLTTLTGNGVLSTAFGVRFNPGAP